MDVDDPRAGASGSGTGSLIRYEGWLHKADPSGGNWKMRYCVLMPQTFCYYKEGDKRDASLQGAFEVRNAAYVHGWNLAKKTPTDYPFAIALPNRTWYFCAASEAERDTWRWHIERTLAALKGAPFDERAFEEAPDAADEDYGAYPGPTPGAMGAGRPGGHMPAIAEAAEENAISVTPSISSTFGSTAQLPVAAAPAPAPAEETVTFYVVMNSATPQERVFTMLSKREKLATLTVAKVKKNLAGRLQVDTNAISLCVPGRDGYGDLECEDEWNAQEIGIDQGTILTLRLRDPDVDPASSEPHQSAGTGLSAPPPPPPRTGKPAAPTTSTVAPEPEAVAARVGMGRQLTSAGDVDALEAATARNTIGPVPDNSAVAARVGMGRQLTSAGDGDGMDAAAVARRISVAAPAPEAVAVRATLGRQMTAAADFEGIDDTSGAVGVRAGMGRQLTSAGDHLASDDAIAARAGLGRQMTSAGDHMGEADASAVRVGMGRQMTSADDLEPPSSPSQPSSAGIVVRRSFTAAAASSPQAKSAVAPAPAATSLPTVDAGLSAATSDRLARRMKLRRVFNALAAGELVFDANDAALAKYPDAPADAAVDRSDFAAALGGDPAIEAWPEYEPLIRALLVPTRTARRVLTWEEFSALLRSVQQELDAAALRPSVAAATAAQARPTQDVVNKPSSAAAPATTGVAAHVAPAPLSQSKTASVPAPATSTAPIVRPPAPSPAIHPAPAPQPATAPAAGSMATTELASPTALPRKHIMVLTVDTPTGQSFDISVCAGDDADALATRFIEQHKLDAAEYQLALTNELRRSLVDAFTLELQDALRAKADADSRAAAANTALTQLHDALTRASADTEAQLVARVKELETKLGAAEAAAEEARANAAAAARTTDEARARASMLESDVQRLGSELEAAARTASDATAALNAYRTEMEESVRRRSAWERYVDGGAAVTAASPAVSFSGPSRTPAGQAQATAPAAPEASSALSNVPVSSSLAAAAGLGDWRAWAAEKREILSRANADRAALIEENKRLRAALDGRGVEAESRLRAADEDRAALTAEKHALQAARDKAEAELANVYNQWETDGRRWASERKRLQEQVDALLAAAAMGGVGSTGGSDGLLPASASGAFAARADMEAAARWQAEREVILRNWSDETALLTSLWNKDKSAWASQREAILRSMRSAASDLEDAMPSGGHTDTEARASLERAIHTIRATVQATATPMQDSMLMLQSAPLGLADR